jgi:hypothetical protein
MSTRRVVVVAVAVWALALGYSVRAQQAPAPAARSRAPISKPAVKAPPNSDCLECHDEEGLVRDDGRPLARVREMPAASVHESVACVECHRDLAATVDFPHPEKLAKADCAECHGDEVTQYAAGIHATARSQGSQYAASCVDCHGMHDIRASSDPQSRTHHLQLAATCGRCHGDPEVIAKGGIPEDVTKKFADSIHGKALSRSGLVVAPTCSDCHGSHDIRKHGDPTSRVVSGHVPATCGTCHEGIARQFGAGAHGVALAKGGADAPSCQTCHTAHAIQRTDQSDWQLSAIRQCGTCHAARIATFRDTFHGQVTALGSRSVAGCADCHGAHEIRPASDPLSPVSPGRLVATCGKCHADASASFVQYDPHANKHDRARNPALFFVSKFMTGLLVTVFAFFGLHTSLWFAKEFRDRRDRRGAGAPRAGGVK